MREVVVFLFYPTTNGPNQGQTQICWCGKPLFSIYWYHTKNVLIIQQILTDRDLFQNKMPFHMIISFFYGKNVI